MGTREQKKSVMQLLIDQYPQYSQEQLRAFIDCRQVRINGATCPSPQELFPIQSVAEIHVPSYVSRGGYKLNHALTAWNMDVSQLVFLDAGSSTGGFTDCLLQRGAQAVHAVDVGYNQLDYRLRSDERVYVHERKNIMHVDQLEPQPHAAVADLSFRSITGAASHILSLTSESWMISLIKPQFEVEKGTEGFTGIVDNEQLLKTILLDVYNQLSQEGVGLQAIIESPIHGRKGNREFLTLLTLDSQKSLSESEFARLLSELLPYTK